MKGFRYLDDATTIELDAEKCVGCGMCTEVCPHAVFRLEGKKARFAARELCIECGACARNCPVGALAVHAGVGCASAILRGWLTGSAPSCGCSDDGSGSGCC